MCPAVRSKPWPWRGYRDSTLGREQVGRVLGLSFWEAEAFVKQRQAYLAYDERDLQQDCRDLDGHAPRWSLFRNRLR
jgi:hypothetical protein